MIDDAGGHEQRSLEYGMIHDVEDTGDGAERRAQAEQQGDESQVADSRVSEQSFEIVLPERVIGAHHQRDDAGAADQREPHISARKHGKQAGQQENACLHHGS